MPGELLCLQHRRSGDVEHGLIYDWIVFIDTEGSALGILEHLDILGDVICDLW